MMEDATAEKVQEYKDSLKSKAEELLVKGFPEKIVKLNDLLETPGFCNRKLSDVHQELNISIPDPIILNHSEDGPATKKPKLDNNVEETSGTKVMILPSGSVPCNKKLCDLIHIVKPYIRQLLEDSNLLKMWISFLIPKIEDGNNFGVSIQEDTLSEIQSVESEAAAFFDQISRYFISRGKIVSKVAKYPHILDYRRAIQELDEKEYTVFRQCVEQNIHNSTKTSDNTTVVPFVTCKEPWPNVPDNVFPNLWRIVYWTSQCLTWLILPLMQSYIKAGDFTIRGKLKSALIDNAIYYGTYLFICGILLIYIALKPGLDLDGQKLKAIASSASNTWGLFLLVLLLGYALVEVPRGLWNASKPGYTLNYSYFKIAKLSLDKCEAEETVDDILESLQIATMSIGPGHPFHCNLETIFQKIPAELKDRMNRRQLPDDTPTDTPTEKSLIRLHRQTIKALQTLQRIETQWGILVDKIFNLEDVAKNQVSHDRRFKPSFPKHHSLPFRIIYNPIVEWYWKCIVKSYVLKIAAICAGCLSVAVVWSEVTFFNKSPVLSLFAQFLNLAKINYDYLTIEILSTLIIAYLCYCAYSTVLKIRVLNLYYLAPHHQTNEYSLIFSGMMLCRLTPPMCLNFLGLIHMDSHIIKTHILETHYTQVMGHMDVISIISDGFNVYFPMAILAFCLATYFSIGSRLLSMLGFQQFLDDDEFTTDLVDEGRELIKRERRKRQRAEDSMYRRRELQERFNISVGKRYRTPRHSTDTIRPLKRDESVESARAGLLHDFDPAEYYIGMTFNGESYGANNQYDVEKGDYSSYDPSNMRAFSTSTSRVGPPPRGLFDDI